MEKRIITIGRQYGSGGREIGEKLAERLELPLYDKDTLLEMVKKMDNYEEIKSFYQEKPVDSLLYAIAMNSLSNGMESKPFQSVRDIVEQKPCVLIGRCGNHIFKDEPKTLRVFIQADLTYRAKRIAHSENVSTEKAERMIQQTDKARASFYRFYTQEQWDSAANYDLALNSSLFGIDVCVDMIIDALSRC